MTAKIAIISPPATFPTMSTVRDDDLFFRTIPTHGHQGFVLGEALSEKGPVDVGLAYAHSCLDQTKALISRLLAAGFNAGKLWLTRQNTGDYSQALPASALNGVNGILEGIELHDAFRARRKQTDPNPGSLRYAAESYDATILAALATIVAKDDSGTSIAATLEIVSRRAVKPVSFGECLDVLTTQDDIDCVNVSGSLARNSVGDIAPAFSSHFTYNTENTFAFTRGMTK